MKTILASILAVAFLASTPAFAGDKPAGDDKAEKGAKKDDKKKDEKKDDKKAGGGW
jgi:ribosomal protein L12E/L44/L45/RPP1/RPP2